MQIHDIMSHPYFAYALAGIVILSFIYFKVLPFFKGVKRIFGKLYMNNKSNISPEQYRKLALGAVYSEQQGAYLNSLETGMDSSKIKTILGDWWGISSPQAARDTLNYLFEKGYRYYFPAIYKAFLLDTKDEKKQVIVSSFADEEDIDKAFHQLNNLEETYKELLNDKVIETKADLQRYGVAGWDCGRLVFVTRLCYDANYIRENEAWPCIEQSYLLAKESFNSWDDFAKSYVIGRALWGGKDSNNSGIKVIADYLLTDPKSPWTQLRW